MSVGFTTDRLERQRHREGIARHIERRRREQIRRERGSRTMACLTKPSAGSRTMARMLGVMHDGRTLDRMAEVAARMPDRRTLDRMAELSRAVARFY